jgi:transcription elongation GreA/GreB family factor
MDRSKGSIMSVAFRRESDEEHLEPKFEIPIPPGPNLVTAHGLARIQTRAEELRALLPTLTDETQINATKRDLRYWHTRHATAELMPVPDGENVAFGVEVTFKLKGKKRTIRIVGDDEADPANNLLSFSAPLSRALMGAEAGDILAFNGEEDVLEVLRIQASC